MTFLADWQMEIERSFAEITELVENDKDLELTYGVVATGLLWPIRAQLEEYDAEAIDTVKQVAPQGWRSLLRFMPLWSPEKLAAAHEMAIAAKRDIDLRVALNHVLNYFNGISLFLHKLLEKKLAGQVSEGATYDVNGLVQGLLVNLGGSTTVQQLHITIGSMIAGEGNATQLTQKQLISQDELLEQYLYWMIAQHERLELRGISKQSGGLTGIKLESVYVALRGDRTSPYEREQSHALLENEISKFEESISQHELSFEDRRKLLWEALGRSPWMPSLEERDRPHLFQTEKTENLSLGEAFCRERWLAILGDPGSGKTTVARWLSLKLAQALLDGKERLQVPASQVDPASDSTELTDLGPARLPVLVRISEFADACREQPGLLLADFLGLHSWLGQFPTFSKHHKDLPGERLPQAQLNRLIKEYLKQGKAVIILDGLDEISVADNRTNVIRAVEKFIDDKILPQAEEEKRRYHGMANLSVTPVADAPEKRGGNQILITSRIAGYHADPLGGQIAHFTIDPMSDRAVGVFSNAWMHVVHEDPVLAQREAEAFMKEIHNKDNPGVRELASNPLLLTILVLIYQDGQSRLPRQRVTLYRMAVDNLSRIWQQRGHELKQDEVIYVLTQIAYHIHETYSTGLIEYSAVRDQIARSLAQYRGIAYQPHATAFKQDAAAAEFEKQVDSFMKVLREEVGLLAARGERLYGFLHLSFQEYFSALYLVQTPELANTLFTGKLDKPRWREPLLLAFGYISIYWTSYNREGLCRAFLMSSDSLKHLLPRSAILLANAIGEMTNLPSERIIGEVVQSLLDTYGGKEGFVSFDLLGTTIEAAIRNLQKTKAAPIVEATLVEALQNISQESWSRGFAAAQIMFKLNWFTRKATRALLKALPLDSAAWDWVINKSLIQITRLHADFLPTDELSFRYALEKNRETLLFVKQDIAWLRVITLLFGGIISQEENNENSSDKTSVEFLHTNIYRNALLSRTLLRSLQDNTARSDVRRLKAELQNVWHHSNVNQKRAEALLALSALGVPLTTFTGPDTAQHGEIFEVAVSYADLVTELMKPMFSVSAGRVKQEILLSEADETTKLDLLRGISRFETGLQTRFAAYAHVALEQKKDHHMTRLPFVPAPSKFAETLLATIKDEKVSAYKILLYLIGVFDQLNDGEAAYQMAVKLDTVGARFETMPFAFAVSLGLLQEAYWSGKCLRVERFPPTLNSEPTEIMVEALNLIDGVRLDNLRSWTLSVLAEVFAANNPDLQVEALTIALPIEQQELRQQAFKAIDASLPLDGDFAALLFRRARALENPLSRARCLWRLLPLLPYKSLELALAEATSSAAQIENPADRSRMHWRLANRLITSPQRDSLYAYAYRDALQITEPAEKARALARLLWHFQGQRAALLGKILDEIARIEDEEERATMLQKILPECSAIPEALPRFQALVEALHSPVLSSLAQDQLPLFLLFVHPQTENEEHWMIVILLSCLRGLGKSLGQPKTLYGIWQMLVQCISELRNQFGLPSDLDGAWQALFPEEDLRTAVRNKLDTVFSHPFRECLQDSPERLEENLKRLWWDTGERAEAFLALTAMGVPLSTFCDASNSHQSDVVEMVITYATHLVDLLRPLLLHSADIVKQEIVQDDDIAETAKTALILALVRFVADYHNPLVAEPQDWQTQRLALWWADVTNRVDQGDDGNYSMMVVLDTTGPLCEATPTIAAKSLALLQEIHVSGKYLQIESFPPALSSQMLDILSEALNVMDGINTVLDGWRSWLFGEMGELFTFSACTLRPEALAICLKIEREGLRKDALMAVDSTFIQAGEEPARWVFQQALALENPLYRARCLWRLIPILPFHLVQIAATEAINSTALIDDPADRSRMYWRLADLMASSQRELFYQHAYHDALRITDPANKTRALARLVSSFQEQRGHLLTLILQEIARIESERERAEMLQRVQPLCAVAPEVLPQFDTLVKKLSAAHLRWLAQDQLLPQLFAYKPQPANNEHYMLVSLLVCLRELQSTFGLPSELAEIWIALLDRRRRARAVNALVAAGVKDSLALTAVAADVLTVLIHEEDRPTLTRLFPLVQRPDQALQPLLLQWLKSPILYIQQMASLLLAETGLLSAQTLPHVFTLFEHGEDRLKCRVALALYDKKLNRDLPRFKLSTIGQETIIQVAQASRNWRKNSLGLRVAIKWFYENLWIDDGDQIEAWAQQVQKNSHEDRLLYGHLLIHMYALTSNAWDRFLQALGKGDDNVQCMLLLSYIGMSNMGHIRMRKQQRIQLRELMQSLCMTGHPTVRSWAIEAFGFHFSVDEQERQLLLSLAEDSDDSLAAQAIVSFGRLARKILHIEQLQQYLQSTRPAIRGAADEAILRYRIQQLNENETDENLSKAIDEMLDAMEGDPERLYNALLRAAQHRWYGAYQDNSVKLGGKVVERFPVFLEWILNELTQILERPEDIENDTIADLLDRTWLRDAVVFDVAAAAAARMPTAFANLVDSERLEKHLVRFTLFGSGPQRTDSITLLSFMRRLSTGVVRAIRNGLNDMVFSQEAVLQAVVRFRNVKGDILSQLAPALYDPSAAFAYAMVQLFQALGTAEATSFEGRQEIMQLLAIAIEDPSSKREVYVLERDIKVTLLDNGESTTEDKGTVIRYMGLLNSAMYQALVKISGIGGSK